MAFWLVTLAILLVVVFPAVLYCATWYSKRKEFFVIGVIISLIGIFVFEWLCNITQTFSNIPLSRWLTLMLASAGTLVFGFIFNEDERSGMGVCIVAYLSMMISIIALLAYVSISVEISASKLETTTTYQQNIEISTYTKTEIYELLSFNLEDDNEQIEKTEDSEIFLGLDRENKILYWCFFYRNDKGAKVMYCLDGEKLDTTKVFETLVAGEKPYFEIVSTVEVQTNNNVSPAEVTENVIKTEYHLYTPDDDYLPRTIYMNFN